MRKILTALLLAGSMACVPEAITGNTDVTTTKNDSLPKDTTSKKDSTSKDTTITPPPLIRNDIVMSFTLEKALLNQPIEYTGKIQTQTGDTLWIYNHYDGSS